MDQRVSRIMSCLSKEYGHISKLVGENYYEIKPIQGFDYRAFLKFVITGDIIREELRYIFGNINGEIDIGAQHLMAMLVENYGSFQTTSAYLSVKIIEDIPYVSLNSYHHFLAKWEDKDIADILQLQLLDIKMGLTSWSFPETIYRFRPSRS